MKGGRERQAEREKERNERAKREQHKRNIDLTRIEAENNPDGALR